MYLFLLLLGPSEHQYLRAYRMFDPLTDFMYNIASDQRTLFYSKEIYQWHMKIGSTGSRRHQHGRMMEGPTEGTAEGTTLDITY